MAPRKKPGFCEFRVGRCGTKTLAGGVMQAGVSKSRASFSSPLRFAGVTWRCGLLFVALLVGCSSSDRVAVHRVESQVFLNDNPATGATVKFIAITPTEETRRLRPMGVVDADGTFRLATYEAGDGAPLGEYIVLVTWPTPDDLTDPAEIPEDWEGLRHRYGDRANSPLRATVKKGNNRLSPFRLP